MLRRPGLTDRGPDFGPLLATSGSMWHLVAKSGRRWAVRAAASDDRGAITPLILGFFLIALYLVTGSVAASDAFSKQRALQSVCDGAALAAANSADTSALHGTGSSAQDLPLANAETAVKRFLATDADRAPVQAGVRITGNGTTVELHCGQHTKIAFGTIFFIGGGIDQSTDASARSPYLP